MQCASRTRLSTGKEGMKEGFVNGTTTLGRDARARPRFASVRSYAPAMLPEQTPPDRDPSNRQIETQATAA